MLNVRSIVASSELKRFSRWRPAEEAKRLHPHRNLIANLYELKA